MHSNDRVQFAKPDLALLAENHTVVDLHFHSTYSDGLNRIPKIAARARKLGIGIAITDHNEIRGALEIEQYDDLLTIPGIELTVAEGSHLLVYFYTTKALRRFYEKEVAPHMGQGVMHSLRLTMVEAIERARRYDCVIIFPHPYCAMYTGICNVQFSEAQVGRMLETVDGVEVINANNMSKWNLKCAVLGFNLGKAMVGGSDGHALHHMGRAVSFADCAANRHDFLDAVRHHANQVVGKEIPLLHKVTTNGLKIRKSIGNCPDLFEKNIRYGRTFINAKSKALCGRIQRRVGQHVKTQDLWSHFGM
ncbi:PHP domain-containing protein [Desulfatitalea alkaliphila]|uniref:PHP domain-containing protein n=1 Tax=Desulfatitalea alkaliphila TaxID=2929485 RepID=A0AA41R240_9BACT|nr:PHP domain-containing protein [Desulfatitalea alkaliphila]MCJ8500619.1 PHP domain-containing protein [Desulfatitalea alkaliphila]